MIPITTDYRIFKFLLLLFYSIMSYVSYVMEQSRVMAHLWPLFLLQNDLPNVRTLENG